MAVSFFNVPTMGAAKLGFGAAEGDPLEALAVVAARQPADMVLADDACPEQPRGARRDG